jgi:hypothetical protein
MHIELYRGSFGSSVRADDGRGAAVAAGIIAGSGGKSAYGRDIGGLSRAQNEGGSEIAIIALGSERGVDHEKVI